MVVAINQALLEKHLFVRLPRHDLWFSRTHRKAFRGELVRQKGPDWLRRSLDDKTPEKQFVFYIEESLQLDSAEALARNVLDSLGFSDAELKLSVEPVSLI
jgi:hypothetical protein